MYNSFIKFCCLFLVFVISLINIGYPAPEYLHGNKPYIIDKKYCGPHVVWHVLNYYKIDKSIHGIVEEMQIEKKGQCTIYDVIKELEINGIDSQAIKLDKRKLNVVDKLFIPYWSPPHNQDIGHFTLCIPDGLGRIVDFDGSRTAQLREIKYMSDIDNNRWDGTAILIEGSRTKNLYEGFFMEWHSLILITVGFLIILILWYRKRIIDKPERRWYAMR